VLKDQDLTSLNLLRLRAREIAGLIVNPVQGFGWTNSTTSTTGHPVVRAGLEAIERFQLWLLKVRETCTDNKIPLIFDETWCFQLGPGGAQDTYGVDADIVTLGKALGGGHAVGAVCGPSWLMERRDPERAMRVSFAVGTFKGSPMVMGSINAVLRWVRTPQAAQAFDSLKDNVARWSSTCNATLKNEDLPISVSAYRTMWCVCYHQKSAYQFLFQVYLRNEGLQMVWVGTGKMLLNLEFREADFQRLTDILVRAGKAFKEDGWWWPGGKSIALLPLVLRPTIRYHIRRLLSWRLGQ